MKKSLLISLLLSSFIAVSCGPSSNEFNRIAAENAQLQEENLALKAALEQCKSELDKYKNDANAAESLAITSEIEVLGRWKVAFIATPNKYYTVEIVKEKGTYRSKLEYSDSDKVTIEQLNKNGDKFFVVGSKNKDYYRIIDGNLHLCDKDGDFTTGAGYKVTRIK